MDSVSLPYLPVSLWILAGATTILILFAAFGFYIYWRGWAADLTETGEGVASLAARKQLLEKDVEALREWIEVRKAELERLVAEREEQERLRAILADLEHQCAVKNQENQELRNEVGELENQRHNVTQILEKMQREIGDLDAKRAEAQSLDSQLAELRSRLEEARQTIRNLAELEVKLSSLSNERVSLERAIEELRAIAESARAETTRLNREAGEARIEAEGIKRELGEARREKTELSVIIDTLRQEQHALEHSTERLEQKIEDLKASSQNAQEEAGRHNQLARKAMDGAQRAGQELAASQKDRQRAVIEVGELNARKAVLQQEVSRLEGKLGFGREEVEAPLAAYADLLEKEPLCLRKDMFGGKWSEQDESNCLQRVKNALQSEGLIFPRRIIDAFHTSLKCHEINPITVLAGVSGTGKTLLPVRYAEIMGMHRLVMAVQPRWDSPQDMFGFYNYLEKEYKATELSRALVRMDPYNYPVGQFPMLKSEWARERLLLVLMDEMNLARTEYYFSEFLSRLELRRTVNDPSLPTNRSEAEIELDAGPGINRFRLWVGHNVFFVGTMNEDETTQTLSDKVLDRANVLRFGKPDENVRAVNISGINRATSEQYLSFDQWKNWQKKFQEDDDWYESVSTWTMKLNAALNRVGRPFGFRVLQAIGHYVANYPRVEDGERYKLAFADQVEQKIITKIRGIDLSTDTANECLEEVGAIIAELDDRDLSGAFESARNESRMVGMFQWRGVTRREDEDVS